jgi:hypothetical protein
MREVACGRRTDVEHAGLRAAGAPPLAYADAINGALRGRPPGMTVAMHACRGNFRAPSRPPAPHDDAVVEAMFATDVDAYFMDWDSERAGGLRAPPPAPALRRRCWAWAPPSPALWSRRTPSRVAFDEAAKYVALERLAPVIPVRLRLRQHPSRQTPSPRASNGASSRSSWMSAKESGGRTDSGARREFHSRFTPLTGCCVGPSAPRMLRTLTAAAVRVSTPSFW